MLSLPFFIWIIHVLKYHQIAFNHFFTLKFLESATWIFMLKHIISLYKIFGQVKGVR